MKIIIQMGMWFKKNDLPIDYQTGSRHGRKKRQWKRTYGKSKEMMKK